jgi:hypothetical protein
MCCTNFEYSKVSLEAVNKPFYGFSQYMCNSVEVVKKCRSGKCLIGLTHCPHLPDLLSDRQERDFDSSAQGEYANYCTIDAVRIQEI